MPLEYKDSELLKDYYRNWISVYKEGGNSRGYTFQV